MENLESKKYWIWLSLIKGLGCIKKKKLLEIYRNPKDIYDLNKKQLLEVNGIGEETASNIINSKNVDLVNKHIEYMSLNDISVININEKEYPCNLKQIHDAPISLYVKGNIDILNNRNIAIIGCRDCSDYGTKVAKYFAYNLCKENINIVSGLAKGIDSCAHIGSLNASEECKTNYGKTIAVVGNGLDMVYPKENFALANRIVNLGGVIISEYPCGTRTDKMNFPARNRIISGISDGVVVVEAKKKSGTLITVDFALEQGRDVFVVPGNINSINSIGTNDLIKQGARCVTTYKEVIYN